jgi:hypothetical protein
VNPCANPISALDDLPATVPGRITSRLSLGKAPTAQRSSQRGAGHLKAIVWTLILIAMVYIGVKVIPILVNEYEFQDSIQNIARFASVNRQDNAKIQKAVAAEAEKDDLPVRPEDIKVEGTNGNVRISVDYAVIVDLSVYQWTLNFHPTASNNALF